jgi:UDP-N-acetylmuramoylalanine--D-glutamate ligase
MDVRAYLKGKKITVMGLGLLGRGVGDARFLAECGAELIVTDLKSEEDLAPSLAVLKEFPSIRYTLGEHKLEDFHDRDFILKAAGVPLNSPYVAEARKNDIPVKMSASWFAELSDAPILGVTGTRGKSTVTHMLHAILKEAGQDVLLGGNVRGVSTLALLAEAKEDSVALFELDSWQLQGFGEAKLSPDVAVFTTFFPDHMNYYGNDMDAYLSDKANIFLNQDATDTLIVGAQCADLIEEKYAGKIKAHVVKAGAQEFRADWALRVPGEHNRYDAALATEAARALNVDDEIIEKALSAFPGVPGRLELVKETNGVRFYNDTTATTPEATLAALDALKDSGIVLIMGGADKGLDMNTLLLEVSKRAKRVIMLAGTGTDRVLQFLPGASVFDSLDAAVQEAARAASPGDVVLFSPAFASFGMFKNEYNRGDQFNAIVKSL